MLFDQTVRPANIPLLHGVDGPHSLGRYCSGQTQHDIPRSTVFHMDMRWRVFPRRSMDHDAEAFRAQDRGHRDNNPSVGL